MSNRLVTGERVETIDDRCVGTYATDMKTGEIVFVVWGTLFAKFESYTIETVVLERIAEETDTLYIADIDTDNLYKFDVSTYSDAKVVQWNGRLQFAPGIDQADNYWPNGVQEMVK